jgi:hypothetical protein
VPSIPLHLGLAYDGVHFTDEDVSVQPLLDVSILRVACSCLTEGAFPNWSTTVEGTADRDIDA